MNRDVRLGKTAHYVDTSVDNTARERYNRKLQIISNQDPYEIPFKDWRRNVEDLPSISYPDIVNYLVNTQSTYTLSELKAYKSLEAYNYFICGWVKDVKTIIISGYHVVSSMVRHSQRLNDSQLQPWLIVEKDGKVIGGHCNCIAGLGEVCSHVGAMLFAVEAIVKVRDSKTVTQEKAYWLLPAGLTKVEYKRVRDIDFTGAKTKKKKLDEKIENSCGTASCTMSRKRKQYLNIPPPSSEEVTSFFQSLHKSGTKPAILSLVDKYTDDYVPRSTFKLFPMVLSELYDERCVDMDKNELLNHCASIAGSITVTDEQANEVEKATQGQASNKNWHRFRAGRVTASRLKAVCKSSIENPSESLIKCICYPNLTKFSNKATRWGCSHEKDAFQKYSEEMALCHQNFTAVQSGLVINPAYPFMGASPDGIVKCDCCGSGCLEVKCPYCKRYDESLSESLDKHSCLEMEKGRLQLKKSHQYYYQVQCQLFIGKKDFCDFVVWTLNDFHCERIQPDHKLWQEASCQANAYFTQVVLLELIAKFYSQPSISQL